MRQKPAGRGLTITALITNTVVFSALFSLVDLSTSSWGSCRTDDAVNANTDNVINLWWGNYCVAFYAGHRYNVRK